MDRAKMGGNGVLGKYLALTSKNYTNTPIKSLYKSTFGYFTVDGPGNWGAELFHYCTIDVLKSITREKKLRFSDIHFLNDTTEFIESIRLLKVIIEKQKDSMNEELYNILTDKDILDSLQDYHQRYSFYPPISDERTIDSIKPICKVYTCSFCMDMDLLPMWNYYAHGAGGVSINFSELERHMKVGKDKNVKLIWGKVWYKESDKRLCIEALLKDISGLFLLVPDKEYRNDMIKTAFISAMNNMRIFMKNENFSTEKEYRAVLIVPEEVVRNKQIPKEYNVGHFNRGNIIIPYIDVPFAAECIKYIIVGSGMAGDFSLIKLGLEDWLLQQDLADIDIYQSNVPMRKY